MADTRYIQPPGLTLTSMDFVHGIFITYIAHNNDDNFPTHRGSFLWKRTVLRVRYELSLLLKQFNFNRQKLKPVFPSFFLQCASNIINNVYIHQSSKLFSSN
jgi:hypothetical protein